jgi:hypothetical protein
MEYSTLTKVLASGDIFHSDVSLEVSGNLEGGTENGVDKFYINFPRQEYKLKWQVDEDWRSWGLKGMSAMIRDQKVQIKYELEDFTELDPEDKDSEPKVTDSYVELELPKEVKIEYDASESGSCVLFPKDMEVELSGKINDPKSWKIEHARVTFQK